MNRLVIACCVLVGCSEAPPGAVRVHVTEGHGALFVDAVPRGDLVDDTVIELPEGSHVLEARRGTEVLSGQTVEVRSSQIVSVTLRGFVPPPPPPPAPPPPPRRPSGDLPPTPTRSDIVGAMNAVAPTVNACGRGAHGLAPVRIVFGSGGQVTSAMVSGGVLPPDVRACITNAARQARVPPFTNPTFSVNYPFRL